MAAELDRVLAALHRRLDTAAPAGLARGMHYPTQPGGRSPGQLAVRHVTWRGLACYSSPEKPTRGRFHSTSSALVT
jgi:hypothetical protein